MVATQIFFTFTPIFCKDSHFDSHFSDGLVQPPTSNQPMSSKGFFVWVYKSGLGKSQVNSIEGCLTRATNLLSTHRIHVWYIYLHENHKFEPFMSVFIYRSSHGPMDGVVYETHGPMAVSLPSWTSAKRKCWAWMFGMFLGPMSRWRCLRSPKGGGFWLRIFLFKEQIYIYIYIHIICILYVYYIRCPENQDYHWLELRHSKKHRIYIVYRYIHMLGLLYWI